MNPPVNLDVRQRDSFREAFVRLRPAVEPKWRCLLGHCTTKRSFLGSGVLLQWAGM
jgi:hypothetical protein